MAIAAFVVGLIGGLLIGQVNVIHGAGWFTVCVVCGFALVLDKICALLQRQQAHVLWFEKLEAYRFGKQYPNAAREWQDAEKAKQAAVAQASEEKTEKVSTEAAAAREAKREAKRRAAEPTFVSRELVPEIPADFKPESEVDFSAFDEVTKPRRKRE